MPMHTVGVRHRWVNVLWWLVPVRVAVFRGAIAVVPVLVIPVIVTMGVVEPARGTAVIF